MKMNLILIIAGIALIAVGVFRMTTEAKADEKPAERTFNVAPKPAPKVRIVEREVVKYVETPAPTATEPAELTPKEKGNRFEDYVANLFKDRSVFSVLEWNQGQTSTEGVFAENDKNPDFKIQQTLTDGFKLVYWVECKYRKQFDNSGCIVIKNYQLNRYRQIQRESHRKILLAIGIGKEPDAPSSFYLIPIDSISDEQISKVELQPFLLTSPASQLGPNTADWFQNQVFKKKRFSSRREK